MKYTFEEKLHSGDLDFNFLQSMESQLLSEMESDEDLKKEIAEIVKDEEPELSEDAVASEVQSRLETMASNAVDNIRIYCSFDLEVSV